MRIFRARVRFGRPSNRTPHQVPNGKRSTAAVLARSRTSRYGLSLGGHRSRRFRVHRGCWIQQARSKFRIRISFRSSLLGNGFGGGGIAARVVLALLPTIGIGRAIHRARQRPYDSTGATSGLRTADSANGRAAQVCPDAGIVRARMSGALGFGRVPSHIDV
jgi:hypothetical protein